MARAAWEFIYGRRLWRCAPRLRTTALESLNTFEECLYFMSTLGNAAAEEFLVQYLEHACKIFLLTFPLAT